MVCWVFNVAIMQDTDEDICPVNFDAASSADSVEVSRLLLSPTGVEYAPILPPIMPENVDEMMLQWQLTGIPLSPRSTASEFSSAVTVSSAASTYVDTRIANGDWLSKRPTDHVNALQLAI